jgi:hypothetical protein
MPVAPSLCHTYRSDLPRHKLPFHQTGEYGSLKGVFRPEGKIWGHIAPELLGILEIRRCSGSQHILDLPFLRDIGVVEDGRGQGPFECLIHADLLLGWGIEDVALGDVREVDIPVPRLVLASDVDRIQADHLCWTKLVLNSE